MDEQLSRSIRELIQAISILEQFGVIDFNGHFSCRLRDGQILINSGDSVRSDLRSSDFTVVAADGRWNRAEYPRPPAELPLHLAVYAARSDVQAVVHGHPKWSTLLTSSGRNFVPVMPQGALLGQLNVFPSPRSVSDQETASAVARMLASRPAALLKAHGSVVVANDVLEATVMAIYLELNAERQVMAAALGGCYELTAEEVLMSQQGLAKRALYEKCWNYYCAKYGV